MSLLVESRMGAVTWSLWPTPRLPSPLIKPEEPISGIRLSDWLHRKAHGEQTNRTRLRHGEQLSFATRHSNLRRRLSLMVFAGSSPITTTSPSSKAHQKSGPFAPPALPGINAPIAPSDSRRDTAYCDAEAATLVRDGSPPVTANHPSDVPCPLPRRIAWVRVSITSPHVRPSPNDRRVGIRIRTFEACSGFTLLRPIGLLSGPRPPSSQGSDPTSYPALPPSNFLPNRHLFE